jgi:hypothetical protein
MPARFPELRERRLQVAGGQRERPVLQFSSVGVCPLAQAMVLAGVKRSLSSWCQRCGVVLVSPVRRADGLIKAPGRRVGSACAQERAGVGGVGADELDRPVSTAGEERQQGKGRNRRGGGDEDDWR